MLLVSWSLISTASAILLVSLIPMASWIQLMVAGNDPMSVSVSLSRYQRLAWRLEAYASPAETHLEEYSSPSEACLEVYSSPLVGSLLALHSMLLAACPCLLLLHSTRGLLAVSSNPLVGLAESSIPLAEQSSLAHIAPTVFSTQLAGRMQQAHIAPTASWFLIAEYSSRSNLKAARDGR